MGGVPAGGLGVPHNQPLNQPTHQPLNQPLGQQRECSLLAETASRQEVMNMQQIVMKMMSGAAPPNKHEVRNKGPWRRARPCRPLHSRQPTCVLS